MLVYI